MPSTFDAIIVGLGAMGSAVASHLARRGKRVLGLDRFSPPHTLGSSHGQTRIIREAYFEHPLYVPLVQRAYELWTDLEKEAGRNVFRQTGGLMIGRLGGVVAGGAKRSADEHRLRYEMLSAAEIRRRFPALQPLDEMVAVWEPRAGILLPEACVETHLTLARRHSATLQTDEAVLRWEPAAHGISVVTKKSTYTAAKLLLTAGSWIQSLVPDLNLPFAVERQVLYWFAPKRNPDYFGPARCPIHLWEHQPGRYFYGFPDLGEGVKVASHHEGEITSPDSINREVVTAEIEGMRQIVRKFLPDADGPLRSAVVCMYTNTPDEHFFIDWHPAHPQVLIASPCSGHGFKFSSAIGEVVTELLVQGKSRFDLSLFRHRSWRTLDSAK